MNLDKLHKVMDLLNDKIDFNEFIVLSAICNWPNLSSLRLAVETECLGFKEIELTLKYLVSRNIIKLIDDWEEKIDFELV